MTLEKPLILSCEHANHRLPPDCANLFRGQETLLSTHRGWDIGAADLAEYLYQLTDAPIFAGEVTRLLVDLNRSVGHPTLHAPFIKTLSRQDRQYLLNRWYHRYRDAVTEAVSAALERGRPVVHLSLHSFAPELNGKVRNADIGLLYDPARPLEAAFCRSWQQAMKAAAPQLRVRCNYPYRGTADSLVTSLRRRFPADAYLGLELEVNQAFALAGGQAWLDLHCIIGETLLPLLCPG